MFFFLVSVLSSGEKIKEKHIIFTPFFILLKNERTPIEKTNKIIEQLLMV